MKYAMRYVYLIFQSTLPQGERLQTYFCFVYFLVISIHAPARGATYVPKHYANTLQISIHAPARGATFCFETLQTVFLHFNPRSREGSDIYSSIVIHQEQYFNPRSREGSDTILNFIRLNRVLFQSTLPRGERHI